MQQTVSILILLEVILEAADQSSITSDLWCFNPYFTGSNSGSYVSVIDLNNGWSFNPYFTGSNSGSLQYCIEI